uniref:Uncharacterized protein n=1 Tax=Arundo donax TaxID=35708 RepID=A0A0A9DDC5_ARUDO
MTLAEKTPRTLATTLFHASTSWGVQHSSSGRRTYLRLERDHSRHSEMGFFGRERESNPRRKAAFRIPYRCAMRPFSQSTDWHAKLTHLNSRP